ncbi:MAG: FG-GAP repeat protein [Pseudomonadota bacterium]
MTHLKLHTTALCLSVFTAVSAHAETAEVWSQRGAALSEPSFPKRSFGDAVAISGSTIVVTSSASDAGTYSGGAAYVYERMGSNWIATGSPLTVDDGIPTAALGAPCALSEKHLIAGALYAASAYAFTRDGSTWGAGERLIGADGPERDWLVTSVSVSGDTAIVGVPAQNLVQAQGPVPYKPPGAYVFLWDGGSWLPQAKLTVDLPQGDSKLGYAVSISGDTAVLTAPELGQTYVFTRTSGEWTQDAPAIPKPSEVIERTWGRAVALSGDTFLISARRSDSAGLPAGVIYEFVRTNGVWVQSASALAPAETDEDFGAQLSFSGDTAIMGSKRAAYVFARAGKIWTQQGNAILTAASSFPYLAVAVDGQYAVVGVAGKTKDELGAAYIFSDACETDVECGSTAFCAAGTCRARCQHDSECASGRFCAADGLCRELVSAGQDCSEASAGRGCKEPGCQICATGHCVDAVCCDSACDGICEACAGRLTGGADGSCLPIAADQDPDDECAEGRAFPASCLADGACDGKRQCRPFAKAGTACGDTVCSDSSVTGSVCDGNGTCQFDSVLCAPYACSSATCNAACKTGTDCDPATGYCLNGKCAEKKPSGQFCHAASECASEICSDSVCCEQACQGPCKSCAEKGSEGQCVALTGAGCSTAGSAGSAGEGGGPAMVEAGDGGDAGDGGRADRLPDNTDASATACGCRAAGGSALAVSHGLLPLLGLLLLGARRRREVG